MKNLKVDKDSSHGGTGPKKKYNHKHCCNKESTVFPDISTHLQPAQFFLTLRVIVRPDVFYSNGLSLPAVIMNKLVDFFYIKYMI